MTAKPKSTLHQFADDLAAAIKSPEFETKPFHDAVAECLEPLLDWRAADYLPALKATADYPAESESFEAFEVAQDWAEDILGSLPKSISRAIQERAHERALQHRGE